jgi:hypothetical protein
MPLTDAIAMVDDRGWEGLVLWNSSEGTVIQMNGKPKRTNCYKLKPVQEDDFVAVGYELGKGRNSNVVGNLKLAQYRTVSWSTAARSEPDSTRPDTRVPRLGILSIEPRGEPDELLAARARFDHGHGRLLTRTIACDWSRRCRPVRTVRAGRNTGDMAGAGAWTMRRASPPTCTRAAGA